MGLRDLFRKKKPVEEPFDPLADLVLAKLRVGYLVDYDLATWEVTGHYRYETGDAETVEWELRSGDEVRYLEYSNDESNEWRLMQRLAIGAIDGDVRQHLIDHEEAPPRLTHAGIQFYLDDAGGGYMYQGAGAERREFLFWEYLDDDEERVLSVQQWGERDFSAAHGVYVEEYQFTNILPAAT